MALFLVLLLPNLIFLLREVTLSTAINHSSVGKENSSNHNQHNWSQQTRSSRRSKYPYDRIPTQGHLTQLYTFDENKRQGIEKAFFNAFQTCHLSDVTELVTLRADFRNQQKNCIFSVLKSMEKHPGEYTQYLRNDTDINTSVVESRGRNIDTRITQIPTTPNLSSIISNADDKDIQQGLLLFLNFTSIRGDNFAMLNSTEQLHSVLQTIPETLNIVLKHIQAQKDKQQYSRT